MITWQGLATASLKPVLDVQSGSSLFLHDITQFFASVCGTVQQKFPDKKDEMAGR